MKYIKVFKDKKRWTFYLQPNPEIEELHSEIIPYIIEVLEAGEVIVQAKDRLLLLHKVSSGKGVAVIRLDAF